ncbi:MAG TPA: hypothetical protein VF865_01300 [Acidobacteriaceae bacterium]
MREETPVLRLSSKLGTDWPAIRAAAEATVARREALNQVLTKHTSEDTSIAVVGSFGRAEVTAGSDFDWVLLVDGIANPEHLDACSAIADHLKSEGIKGPGAEAIFGELVFSHDLIHYIGGDEDTNANLTRRMLLLLESAPLGREDAYARTTNNILSRYILEDFGWMHARNPMNVPRFLQNDIARYWRTMAVDFAYKRRRRAGRGWALRTSKLRLPRKLTYAAGLLMCYSCALDPEISTIVPSEAGRGAAAKIVAHLATYVRKTPLEIFAELFLTEDSLTPTARKLFATYDEFLALLNDDAKRERLETLPHDEVAEDPVYQAVRDLGHQFQEALDEVFLDPTTPKLYQLTKTYGVF